MRLFKPFCLTIGLRYCFSSKHPLFLSLASLSSVVGITLGIAILVTVMSVMNGFVLEMRGHLSQVHHPITFMPWQTDWRSAQSWLEQQPEVLHAAPFIQVQSLLKNGEHTTPVMLESSMDPKDEKILGKGGFKLKAYDVFARKHGIDTDQPVWLISAKMRMSLVGNLPTFRRFTVSILKPSTRKDSDDMYRVWTDFTSARLLAGLSEGEITGLSVQIKDPEQAAYLVKKWQGDLQTMGWLRAWSDDYKAFFESIVLQKTMMFLVLMLIVIMAIFSLISGLIMLVANKRQEIAILKTMGWSPGQVWALFMTHGLACTLLGMVLGSLLGIYVSHHVTTIVEVLEALAGEPWLSHALYGMDHMPSQLLPGDILWVNIATLLLSVVATTYPALKATRIDPVTILKNGGGL